MKKRVIGMAMAVLLLAGSSLTVSAEEAAPAPAAQSYQQTMTPEILASFQLAVRDDLAPEQEDQIIKNAILLRTDIWGSLQDADGNGIDDRDPVNSCGYIDLNINGFDDRFEAVLVNMATAKDPAAGPMLQRILNMLTHRCNHGICYSAFNYNEEKGCFVSVPDYFDKCPECKKALIEYADALSDMTGSLFGN